MYRNSNLPIETLHPQKVPPGPWVKLGMDFFQDHHGKKYLIIADYFSKFLYIFQWHPHIISRPSENSSQLKAYLPLWCLTMALHSMETNSKGLLESSTSCTPHHHLISTNPMASLRPWWRRSRIPTKKLMDLPMLKQEHYFSYETHLSWQVFLLQLKYFMDDQHKEQSFQDPQKGSTYNRFITDSLKFKTLRRNSSTEHTEQRIYECSRWMNK